MKIKIEKFQQFISMVVFCLVALMNWSTLAAKDTTLFQTVSNYEQKYNIPNKLLWTIAKIESGNNPYALNIEGKAYKAGSKEEALKVITLKLNEGLKNIDIGLMQVSWRHHGHNFSAANELLDTDTNIEYAAVFLKQLYDMHGTWQKAVQHYHSAKPKYHGKYGKKVLITWIRLND
jgi:soluble lytic murein transglycosylase-like protein